MPTEAPLPAPAAILARARAGDSPAAIAAELHLSPAAVVDLLDIALDAAEIPLPTALRLEARRLDAAQNAIWPAVLAGDAKAIDLFLKLHDRRVRLWSITGGVAADDLRVELVPAPAAADGPIGR